MCRVRPVAKTKGLYVSEIRSAKTENETGFAVGRRAIRSAHSDLAARAHTDGGRTPIDHSFRASAARKTTPGSRQALDDLNGALRCGFQESFAVAFVQHAIVQNHNDPAVIFGSNQSAHTLPELQNRFGQGKLGKGIAAARFDSFQARFDKRVVGHSKRQPRDDDIGKRFTGNIDALPETVGAEKHRIDVLLELLKHQRTRRASALNETLQAESCKERR